MEFRQIGLCEPLVLDRPFDGVIGFVRHDLDMGRDQHVERRLDRLDIEFTVDDGFHVLQSRTIHLFEAISVRDGECDQCRVGQCDVDFRR